MAERSANDPVGRAFRTRIAPTPSGFLHAGNAVNFLIAFKLAREAGGSIFLRIDDLDAERMRPAYVEDIFRSLEWLGITWDEGPSGPEDFHRNWSQRLRLDRYVEMIQALRVGGHLYACTCSRKQFPSCTCAGRGRSFDAPGTAWRLQLPSPCPVIIPGWSGAPRTIDLLPDLRDPVIRQRNGLPSYQIASLADDIDHTITVIVRGEDLLPSSACQLHVARLLGDDHFPRARFIHHPLLTDARGGKLSKSAGASSLKAMRESGMDASQLHAMADRMLAGMTGGADH